METTSPERSSPRIAFISGHIDLPEPSFLHPPRLRNPIKPQFHPLQLDTLALNHLLSKNVDPSRITIYLHTKNVKESVDGQKYRDLGLKVVVVEGEHTERDAEITKVSDYDIAWVRSEEETRRLYGRKFRVGRISGTRKNLDRRAALRIEAGE